MPTIEQVALLAKVSVATVSRVINNSAYVSDDTRQRVNDAIERLNYQPNALGKMLRKESTQLILVLLHSVDNPFFSKIIQGIEEVAHQHQYNVIICNTYGDLDREQHYLNMLKNHLVDGAIFISNTTSVKDMEWLEKHYPIAQVVEYYHDCSSAYFSIDFYKASTDMMNILLNAGHKHIGFVHTGSSSIISAQEKFRAYVDSLQQKQLPLYSVYPTEVLFGFSEAKAQAEYLLNKHPEITAFFSTSDMLAAGIIDELLVRGKSIPEDAMVTGFDNTDYSIISTPMITTVELNSFDLGSKAMEYLLRKISDKKTEPECYFGDYRIVHRTSTKK